MNCPHCASSKTSPRSRLTSQGYPTFYCNNCRRGFNEQTNSPFNRAQVPTPIIFEVVLCRLRYKLSLKDLAEMFWTQGFYFTKETVRLWEAKYAPLLTVELKLERKRQVTTRWKADETMIRVKQKLFYLYRAIDTLQEIFRRRIANGGKV